MGTNIIRRTGLAIQVCSDETDEKVLTSVVNEIEPSGTENGWSIDDTPKNPDGGVDPRKVQCKDAEEHYHYVFIC